MTARWYHTLPVSSWRDVIGQAVEKFRPRWNDSTYISNVSTFRVRTLELHVSNRILCGVSWAWTHDRSDSFWWRLTAMVHHNNASNHGISHTPSVTQHQIPIASHLCQWMPAAASSSRLGTSGGGRAVLVPLFQLPKHFQPAQTASLGALLSHRRSLFNIDYYKTHSAGQHKWNPWACTHCVYVSTNTEFSREICV